MRRIPARVWRELGVAPLRTARLGLGSWRLLAAVTRVDLAKRYSGSALGGLWVLLYPLLFLCIYLFVFLVVFRVRFPGFSQLDYVVYVFCGLIPFIALSEAISGGLLCLKQNMHLVRNVMMPVALIPIRNVMVAMPTLLASVGLLLLLAALNGSLGPLALAIPVVVVLQMLLHIGIVYLLSPLALVLPDLAYFVNLGMMLLMFMSPIAFRLDMVPNLLRLVIYANPIYYVAEAYRVPLLAGELPGLFPLSVYLVLCLGTFALGSAFFQRFQSALADFE